MHLVFLINSPIAGAAGITQILYFILPVFVLSFFLSHFPKLWCFKQSILQILPSAFLCSTMAFNMRASSEFSMTSPTRQEAPKNKGGRKPVGAFKRINRVCANGNHSNSQLKPGVNGIVMRKLHSVNDAPNISKSSRQKSKSIARSCEAWMPNEPVVLMSD